MRLIFSNPVSNFKNIIMHMQSLIKKLSGAIFLAAFILPVMAQNKPAYEMTVDGVKVIVQPSGNEIVEILTVFKGCLLYTSPSPRD